MDMPRQPSRRPRWVTAQTAGRVERRLVEPGQTVTPETVLLVLTNPDIHLEALDSERRLRLYDDALDRQLGLQQAQVRRLEAVEAFQKDRVKSMDVTAGAAGVLQELPLEVGQWVQSDATLATWVPARRATRVDPVITLQAE